ncbi:hypothetical protein BOX15_Mlig001419g2, partial [Macrostomum lignano]
QQPHQLQQPGTRVATPGNYLDRVSARVLRGLRIMGIIQVLVGIFAMGVSIAGLVIGTDKKMVDKDSGAESELSQLGSGVRAGPFFIAAGISGIIASRPGCCCPLGCVVTCLVLSILAAVSAFSAIITEAFAVAQNRTLYENAGSGSDFTAYHVVYSTGIVCALLCGIELAVASVHSAFACCASCCCVPSAVSSETQQRQHQQHVVTNQPGSSSGPQAGYSGPQAGYPGQQAGYPGPQTGYQGPQAGYPGTQTGYPGTQTGYPGPQTGYPGPQAGYPGPQTGYPGPQAGYPGPQAGYPGPQGGYPGPQGSSTGGRIPDAPPSYEASMADAVRK